MTIYQPLQVKRSNIPNHKPASLAEGEIAANVKDGILFLGLEDNTVVKFYNSTNFYDEDAQFDSNVSDGDVVYKGSDGKYYQALADGSEKSNVVGIADVTNSRIISQGFISTSYSFNINDKVYLSQDTPGAMTNTPTIVSLGIYLGNGVILIAGRGGGSGEGLPYKSKLTLSSTYTVPNDYGAVVPEKFEVEEGGELVIEENGVFMIVDNEKLEKVYAFDSERLGNIPAADYFNYEGATKYSTLNDAVEAVGSANKDLLIKGNVTVDSDLTIPENVNLVFTRNGKITVNSGVTLTINGGIQAGLWQIFDGNGTVTGNPKIEAVYPEWFGAKGDGVTDDTEAIQKTLLFGNRGCIKFQEGKVYVSNMNDYMKLENTIIDGNGATLLYTTDATTHGIPLDNCRNLVLRDLYIKAASNDVIANGITFINHHENILLENCTFENIYQFGISFPNAENSSFKNFFITNCKFLNMGNTAGISNCIEFYCTNMSYNLVVANCYCEYTHPGGNIAKFQNVSNALIVGNVFKYLSDSTASSSQAIHIGGDSEAPAYNIIFANNYVEMNCSAYGALGILVSDRVKVIGNILKGTGCGIVFSTDVRNCYIEDNYIYGDCICIGGTSLQDVIFKGNYGHVNFYSGKPDNINNFIVKDNFLYFRPFIDAENNATQIKFIGNIVDLGNAQGQIEGTNVEIKDNYFVASESPGSSTYNCLVARGDDIKIVNNHFKANGNRSYCLFVTYASNCVVVNNFFDDFTNNFFTASNSDNYFVSNNYVNGTPIIGIYKIFEDGDTTPSVAKNKFFKTNNSSAVSITTFDDGSQGQEITVIFGDSNTTIVHGLGIYTKSGADVTRSANTTMKFVYDGSYWYEV